MRSESEVVITALASPIVRRESIINNQFTIVVSHPRQLYLLSVQQIVDAEDDYPVSTLHIQIGPRAVVLTSGTLSSFQP